MAHATRKNKRNMTSEEDFSEKKSVKSQKKESIFDSNESLIIDDEKMEMDNNPGVSQSCDAKKCTDLQKKIGQLGDAMKNKGKKSKKVEDTDPWPLFPIGLDKQLKPCFWKEERRIDLRVYNNGFATKTGISITGSRFNVLLSIIEKLADALIQTLEHEKVDYEVHLGGNLYAYVKSPFFCVQIRYKYKQDGEMKYSPTGISLKPKEFKEFMELIPVIEELCPDLEDIVPCMYSGEHSNQLYECDECRPDTCQPFSS